MDRPRKGKRQYYNFFRVVQTDGHSRNADQHIRERTGGGLVAAGPGPV